MVKIRLTRIGKKGQAEFRIIAIQARTKRNSEALDFLGYYNPRNKPSVVQLNKERIKYWLGQGAQPTDTVRGFLVREGLLEAPKEKKQYKKQPGRKATERAAEKASANEAK